MSSDSDVFFKYGLASVYLMCPPIFISLHYLQAPYGKHNRPGWGPSLSPPVAWFLMESPTLWVPLLLFSSSPRRPDPRALLLFSPYLLHYLNRTLLYPIRLFGGPKRPGFPLSIATMAFGFNLLNAFVQARWVAEHKDYDADRWFWWRFPLGLGVFAAGMALNVVSDAALVRLKREGGGYKVPRGGWFDAVSCPNYLGELLEWLGWAVMGASWASLAFFLYTCANLLPRARANHKWYLDKFGDDYPTNRKAVIPYLY